MDATMIEKLVTCISAFFSVESIPLLQILSRSLFILVHIMSGRVTMHSGANYDFK
jgi:hypothetical protein